MSEIEKLYENAGIAPELLLDARTKEEVARRYPPFTAEKQLEITKFLFQQGVVYYAVDNENLYWFHVTDDCENRNYKPYDKAIAECINNLWQSLTDVEKEQIRNILKG